MRGFVNNGRRRPAGWRAVPVLALLLIGAILQPTAAQGQAEANQNSILFLVDTSGSMRGTKLTEAKTALSVTLDELGALYDMGLREFSGSCTSPGSLLIPVGPVDAGQFQTAIDGLTAGGGTPTSAALRLAAGEVPAGGTIVLVADGDDQCGRLCDTARSIIDNGIDVTVHAVGVQVGGAVAETLRCAADATGGDYVDVSDPGQLTEVITNISTGNDRIVTYAPKVLFHTAETAYPMDPDDFVAGSQLFWASDFCRDGDPFDASPTSQKLGTGAYTSFPTAPIQQRWSLQWGIPVVDIDICEANRNDRRYASNEFTRPFKEETSGGLTRPQGPDGRLEKEEGFYLDYDGFATGTPVGTALDAPAFYIEDGDTVEYWFFYGQDPKSVLSFGDEILAHEGDWEHVEIVFDGNTPRTMEYFGHSCSSGPIPWALVPKDGTHPLVYVAEGTHASYPDNNLGTSNYCPPDSFIDVVGYLEGSTDKTNYVAGTSVEWETWNGIGLVAPATQCWYGFGGAWGDTGAPPVQDPATGPLGLPFTSRLSSEAQPSAPDDCIGAIGLVEIEPLNLQEWLQIMRFRFIRGLIGQRFVFTLFSTPMVLGEGVVDADGVLDVELQVPPGTPPGVHRVVAQDADTGKTEFVTWISVVIPDECGPRNIGQYRTNDQDGDYVLDFCDPNPNDGDLADLDGDGVLNAVDNCPSIANPDQATTSPGRLVGMDCDERLDVNVIASYPRPAYLDGPFCSYFVPTIIGTDGDDELVGTNGRDVIWAGPGDDTVTGANGDDIVCGGPGNDVLEGGNGKDQVYGGAGDDVLSGGNGKDALFGDDGDDDIAGGPDADIIDGGNGRDTATADNKDDCNAEQGC